MAISEQDTPEEAPAEHAEPRPWRIRGITRNVVILGWVSFFTDHASEMLYPVMPLFRVGTLGASPALLGLIDGLAEGISSGLRWIMGALSDRFRRRKPFVVAGCTLSALTRPLMGVAAFAIGWPLFLVARCADRLGKSVRTSAWDALIADSTQPQYRGAAFGFHRAVDTFGAVVGPLAALLIVTLEPDLPLAWLFFVAFVPGLLNALLALLAVKDIPHRPGERTPPSILHPFPRPFWTLIAANALFSLVNSSDSFLILRSNELRLTFRSVILAFALYNAVYSLGAIPLGRLSDRIGRKPDAIGGWLTHTAVYPAFAWTKTPWTPWVLFPMYGLYQAFSEGVTKAMVSDVVPQHERAGAIGLFSTVSGLGQLVASVLRQVRLFNNQMMLAFLIGAVCAVAAVPVVATVRATKTRGVA